ncbi:MAG TPA: ribonuclease III [Caulobacteraceae bacterium]|nr:ribonuclease III [Caulobacteraceae bacterium]
MPNRAQVIAELEVRLGRRFENRAVLERALTHASARKGRGRDNETLEFLGDRVLGLVAAETLIEAYPDLAEGELSQLQARLVSGEGCAAAAARIGLASALRLAAEARRRGSSRVLGDAMEALMAAAYLDGGLEAARAVFQRAWGEAVAALGAAPRKDAKSALQEWAMARSLPLPDYRVRERRGPEHAPHFVVEVRVEGRDGAQGEGASRRAAEMAAASALLARLGS